MLDLWFSLIGLGKNEQLPKPSASVELCETEVCFLYIQLIGTNVWLPKIHKKPPNVDFLVFQISGKIRIPKQS